jgi:ABC-type transporter Mla maintaining outer membrane lipid asymmetry ATPase subunit MlaF
MVLHEGRLVFEGSGSQLLAANDAFLKQFMYNTLPPW